ncbi:uncharacterized protein LOC110254611 [Exaiptasia diaphana]|uniref:Capsule synthesis protein CapA domain-containing protein n=1 Tax=Exaiptasia diaphana TaxID=2652724 RepID=A0A913YX99_EXADI|nr:uncharacterized protein LOC110254611 [Exaiptasia diaphana]KXJ28289.1 Capsule biosynthesis protein CapA [Exaiptasia diaphana]
MFSLMVICEIIQTIAGVTLDFVGDINFDGAPKYYNNEGLCSYSKTFANVAPLFNKSDFVIGNLESPFVQEDMKKDAQREFVPLLHANPSSIDALKFAGFDIVTLANNHLNDYKTRPINYTVDLLQEHGILSFGYSFGNLDNEQPQIPVILEKDDIKIGFLGYCSCYKRLVDLSTGDIIFYHFCVEKRKCLNIGPAIYSDQAATRDVKELKERVDVIVVMMHWGEEYLTTPTESQQQQAQHLQTIGVHVVIGAHPHVLEGHTLNGRSLIAYSLGNFLFGPKYMTKVFYANPDPSKKMMEGFEKLMATSAIDDNSLDSRILRVELNKQGVVRAAYIPIQISLNPKTKCLQPTPTNDTTWITVCGVDDKACLK